MSLCICSCTQSGFNAFCKRVVQQIHKNYVVKAKNKRVQERGIREENDKMLESFISRGRKVKKQQQVAVLYDSKEWKKIHIFLLE